MPPRRLPITAAAALLLAVLAAPSPSAAQERAEQGAPEPRQEVRGCRNLAAPAAKTTRAQVEGRKAAEVQARLPELLARFAAQPGLEAALDCLMRRQPRG